MARVLLLATTTGYQTRAFGDAAERLGIELVFATDRCNVLEDPWRDHAIPVRFHDEAGSAAAILDAAGARRLDGVLAVGDRPTVLAALVSHSLFLPGHPPEAAEAARNKLMTRERLHNAELPTPWFVHAEIGVDPHQLAESVAYPCVIKPIALSGSRGVMRANNRAELVASVYRLRALMQSVDIRAERNAAHDTVIVEGFVEGHEYAVEGVLNHGRLHVLAIFDKPDPLDGPFFEETLYVTVDEADAGQKARVAEVQSAVAAAAKALGLHHGPIHAECRVGPRGVFVLEVAARPIGGLCARALRFLRRGQRDGEPVTLEELLLRHALGETSKIWTREPEASGVMMIPIPRRGVFRGVSGVDVARAVPGVTDIRITAKVDQVLVPLPEGASYLGFIFARGSTGAAVEQALRDAYRALTFDVDPEMRVLQSVHG
ncbi:MAG TPA: ATP-grasp domain-containing protein [Vicinamibacterales bacterium]